tara:strand:- start:10675 stop:11001 length:327 start_codon:yes stop_codon:yes gene_type:complete
MRIKGIITLMSICIVMSGCGSISTIPESNSTIRSELVGKKTKCNWIPRLYSGVAYGFCRLHAKPTQFYEAFTLDYYIFDIVISGAVDTLALPYTAYLQYKTGSIELNK